LRAVAAAIFAAAARGLPQKMNVPLPVEVIDVQDIHAPIAIDIADTDAVRRRITGLGDRMSGPR
jgi:hypothetical protein